MSFVGIRRRTTEVLQKKMYKDDIVTWLSKADEHDGPTPNSRYFPHSSKSTKPLFICLKFQTVIRNMEQHQQRQRFTVAPFNVTKLMLSNAG